MFPNCLSRGYPRDTAANNNIFVMFHIEYRSTSYYFVQKNKSSRSNPTTFVVRWLATTESSSSAASASASAEIATRIHCAEAITTVDITSRGWLKRHL